MLSREEFIRLSLEVNLFFGRIAKEHSIFIETSFTGRDQALASQADVFKRQYEAFLAEAISLSQGVLSPDVLASGELFTQYTIKAEEVSQFYTGVPINKGLTLSEAGLSGSNYFLMSPQLEYSVYMLNQKGISLTTALADFKARLLSDVLTCRLFTTNYPLLLDHILREARFYLSILSKLQRREDIFTAQGLLELEIFWNRIMAEHAKFIRGLLDPTETELIGKAENFGREFDQLESEALAAMSNPATLPAVTSSSLKETKEIRDFKAAGTSGLIGCKIKAIAYPLLTDHVLREANHFIRILKKSPNSVIN